jgi:hypothetical protein
MSSINVELIDGGGSEKASAAGAAAGGAAKDVRGRSLRIGVVAFGGSDARARRSDALGLGYRQPRLWWALSSQRATALRPRPVPGPIKSELPSRRSPS